MVAPSTYLAAAFLTTNAIMAAQGSSDDAQVVLSALETTEIEGWRVTVSTEWDVGDSKVAVQFYEVTSSDIGSWPIPNSCSRAALPVAIIPPQL